MKLLARGVLPALLLPLVAAAAAGCDIVTSDLQHTEQSEVRRSFDLQPGGRVEIVNVNGRIHVERAEGNTVEVLATKRARGATPEAAKEALTRIEIVEDASPERVRLETKMPRRSWFQSGGAQVTYEVRVPAGADVRFTTVNGGVELDGLEGRIVAETTNGGITARQVAGSIEASTTNGGVDVDLVKLSEGGVELECTNGGIELRLPADARATISASVANGGIDASGLELETTESSRRRLEASLNGGGIPIRIEGTNGGITIRPR